MATKKKSSTKKRGFWRTLGLIILICFLLSIFFTVIFRWVNPPVTPLMVIRKVQYGYPIEKKWKDIDDISPYMVKAAIASEDCYFLGHNGFDVIALDIVMQERKNGVRKRGGSTISQQTAKNVFCWPRSSWVRKGLETYYTFLIETFWSKERIMEVYLNSIEMGKGIYGAEACAMHNFDGKTAAELTRADCALIAATLPNPLKFSSKFPSVYIRKRRHQIENQMRHIDPITTD